MSEISCRNCESACCKPSIAAPYILQLTDKELAFMEASGNKLVAVVDPVKYERDDAPYPTTVWLNKSGDVELATEDDETWHLPAGFGRYIMIGACGYLTTDINNHEQCSVYIQRPQACRDFQVGSLACMKMREIHEVPLPLPGKRSE